MVVRIDPIIRAIALSIPLDSLAPTVDRWLIGGRAPVRLCARARAPCCARGMVPVRWTGAPVAMVPVRWTGAPCCGVRRPAARVTRAGRYALYRLSGARRDACIDDSSGTGYATVPPNNSAERPRFLLTSRGRNVELSMQEKRHRSGDVCRKRRLYRSSEQCQWYAYYRSLRFNRRLGLADLGDLQQLVQMFHSKGK